MGWIKDFFTNIFGSFWGKIADMVLKFLVGPVAYYLFDPIYELSGKMVEHILERIAPKLGDVGVTLSGLGAWFVEVLLVRETLSMFLTFLILSLTLRLMKAVF